MVKHLGVLLVGLCLYGQSTEPPKQNTPSDVDKPADKHVLGVLPNYRTANPYTVYKPLTAGQKMTIARKDSFDYPLYILGLGFALSGQISNDDPSYGQGMQGFAKRYAANYGDQMIGNMLTEGVFPAMLHEDPRYFRLAQGSVGHRTWYALTRIFVTKTDSGHSTFNFAEWGGNAAGVAITRAYHPDQRTARDAASKLGVQCSVDAISQVLKEFWPDVRRHYAKKKQTATP